MNWGPLSIGQPWILWALLVCPIIALGAWRSRVVLSSRMLALVTATRVLAVALAVLAVGDTRARWPTHKLAVALVVDDSASVSPAEALALRTRVQRLASRNPGTSFTLIDPSSVHEQTDLASPLETALGVLPTDRVRRVVLATDGRETVGDVIAAADHARHAGATVSVLALGDHPPVDQIAVTGVDAPRLVRAGRPSPLGVRIQAATARTVRLEVRRDGVLAATSTVTVPAGASVHDVNVEFPDEGVHPIEVRAIPDVDTLPANNTWRTLVRVVSPPRVLLVHELDAGEPVLATVFRDAKLRVDSVRAGGVPDGAGGLEPYQFVVLDELTLTSLSEAQQHALRDWVEQRGGGLLTVTGTHGVGRDPPTLREIEPVRPPRAIPDPRPLELILVIDHSGSMQGSMANARGAGVAAVHALRIDAHVGIVSFSGSADLVHPVVTMDQAGDVAGFISHIQASGGTDIGAALAAANSMVTSDPRYLHHVILMSDGESAPGPALEAARAIAAHGATITAITLGPRNELMAEIARIGRGRYHVTAASSSLPALFVREAQYHIPPPSREMAFHPVLVRAMQFTDGVDFGADPAIAGFVLADTRPGADTILGAPEQSTLLAHWYVGLGQVATFASATSGRWSDQWRTGQGFRKLFSQMAWQMMRAPSEEQLELHVDAVRGHPELRRVSAVSATVAMNPEPVVTLSRGGPPLHLPMHARGPGVWQTEVPTGAGFVVDARLPSAPEPQVAVAADAPYADELMAFGSDAPGLAAIASAGGGRVLHNESEVFAAPSHDERVLLDIRVPLLAAAIALYLLGVLGMRWR